MTAGSVLVSGLKILAVCLLFALCFMVAGALSGLNKIAQQAPPSSAIQQVTPTQHATSSAPEAPPNRQPAQMPENFLTTFLTYSVCVGVVLSYLILRSSWRGWPLIGALCMGVYGISTVAVQVESVFFLSNKFPRGMVRALFLQGAIATALFVPIAVLLLGKWRAT